MLLWWLNSERVKIMMRVKPRVISSRSIRVMRIRILRPLPTFTKYKRLPLKRPEHHDDDVKTHNRITGQFLRETSDVNQSGEVTARQ